MKTARRLILALLFCIALLSGVHSAAYAEIPVETLPPVYSETVASGTWGDLTWTLDDTGTLTISGSGPMDDHGNFSAWKSYKSEIKTVKIESGVTTIGSYAFEYCRSLTSVTIPDSVTSIGDYAFSGCSGLTSVTIPNSVTTIGQLAFSGCSGLTSVTIPNSVTTIGQLAFENCTGLNAVYIDDLAAWCQIAFSGNAANPIYYAHSLYLNNKLITDLMIPDSVTSIGSDAFDGCTKLTSVTIPNSVTNIGSDAFYGCSGLTSVAIPNSVTTIGQRAFSGCSGLTSVAIPNSVTTIGQRAFYNCTGLNAVYIDDLTAWCQIAFSVSSSNPISYAHSLYLNNELITDLIIPDSVTSIVDYAFYGCSGLTSVTIPENVTSIGSSAFYGCSGLTSVTIPENVTSIGSSAFYGCSGLTSAGPIGSGCDYKFGWKTKIPSSAFSGCSGLASVTIPESVTSIGSYAFEGCNNLNAVYIDDLAAWCEITFSGNSVSGSFTNSANPISSAHNLYLNNELITDLVIPDSVTSISTAFSGCSCLTSVTIPTSITSIGDYAFSGCSGLTSVAIPASVTDIGDNAFSGCSGLTSVTIPEGVISIGVEAFSFCSGLTSVSIPVSVTSIDHRAFYYCTGLNAVYTDDLAAWCQIDFASYASSPTYCAHNLYLKNELVTDLVIPDGVTSISAAFSGCSCLTSVTIPESVTSIGGAAFLGCSGLTSVTIPESVTSIGDAAFSDCSGLTSVTIMGSVTTIDYQTFSNCRSLTSVTLPASVTSIRQTSWYGGFGAFEGCSSLTSVTTPVWGTFSNCPVTQVTIPDGTTSIADRAFYLCTGLTSVTIPASVTSIGADAFLGCSGLNSVYYNGDLSAWCEISSANSRSKPPSYRLYVNNEVVCDLVIPDGVTGIADCAFSGCSGLTSVTFPDSVTTIADCAFSGCSGLTSVTFPDSVTTIGDSAFSGCIGLTSVTIPTSVTSIGKGAFDRWCYGLKYVYYGGTPAQWRGISIGNNNDALTNATIVYTLPAPDFILPASLTRIDEEAFAGGAFSYVKLSDKTTAIGPRAFADCPKLEYIYIPAAAETIAPDAFAGVEGLTILGASGSAAETFAGDHGYLFAAVS